MGMSRPVNGGERIQAHPPIAPSPGGGGETPYRRPRGAWLLAAGALLFGLSSLWSGRMAREAAQLYGGPLPPRLASVVVFIRQDLHAGLPHALCLLACVILGAATLRRYRPYAGLLICFAL